MRYLAIILLLCACSVVSANDIRLEFNQVDDYLVIREYINGTQVSSMTEKSALEDSSDGLIFLRRVVFDSFADSWVVTLNLDEGFVIGDSGIFPSSYEAITDGHTISIVWEGKNLPAYESIAFFVILKEVHDNSFLALGVVILLLLVSISFFSYHFLVRRKNNADKYLLDVERKVIIFLRSCDRHESWQRAIQKEFSLSKAKTSRLIRNLESRGLVEKIPFGNTNKVRLR